MNCCTVSDEGADAQTKFPTRALWAGRNEVLAREIQDPLLLLRLQFEPLEHRPRMRVCVAEEVDLVEGRLLRC